MQKYFIRNEGGQEGPYSPEELLTRGLGPDTPVWYEGLDNWTTASQVEELRNLLASAASAPVSEAVTPEPAPVTPAPEMPAATAPEPAPVTVAAPVTASAPRKKGNPVISWVLSLAVLGGTGFYVYQDIEKNKDQPASISMTGDQTGEEKPVDVQPAEPAGKDEQTASEPVRDTTAITAAVTDPVPADEPVKTADDEKKKQAALIAAKKKEEDKKKLAAAEAKKKEEEKKKQLAAEALAAKEMEMRNKWVKYVTLGSFQIEGDDKVKPFDIPVYNGYAYPLEKVTLRVDYLKKEKIVATETLTLNNVPAKGSLKANATGNKKGKTANVYITGASSRGMHFCYPSTGGKNGDPYYCN